MCLDAIEKEFPRGRSGVGYKVFGSQWLGSTDGLAGKYHKVAVADEMLILRRREE